MILSRASDYDNFESAPIHPSLVLNFRWIDLKTKLGRRVKNINASGLKLLADYVLPDYFFREREREITTGLVTTSGKIMMQFKL